MAKILSNITISLCSVVFCGWFCLDGFAWAVGCLDGFVWPVLFRRVCLDGFVWTILFGRQSVGALGELLINYMFVATSWDGF